MIFSRKEMIEMNAKQATNIYESMVIEVYEEYFKKTRNNIEAIDTNIINHLINSDIKDFQTTKEVLMNQMSILVYLYSVNDYVEIFSYKKDDSKTKYKKYADYNSNLFDAEMTELSWNGEYRFRSTEVLRDVPDEEVNERFNKYVYEKMQYNIANKNEPLEFKIEDGEDVHVLLISKILLEDVS